MANGSSIAKPGVVRSAEARMIEHVLHIGTELDLDFAAEFNLVLYPSAGGNIPVTGLSYFLEFVSLSSLLAGSSPI